MKKVILSLATLLILAFHCSAQQINLAGQDNQWRLFGEVPAYTPFQVEAHGEVDFGCWYGCKDGVDAAVDGNAFFHFIYDGTKTVIGDISAVIQWIASNSNTVSQVVSAAGTLSALDFIKTGPPGGWTWINYIDSNYSVNYDEGGFWLAFTTDKNPPNLTNVICTPALYYYYLQLYKTNINILYHKDIFVWARIHDGGRDPYNTSAGDYSDNSGSYSISIWLNPDPASQSMSFSALTATPEIFKNFYANINLRSKKSQPVALVANNRYELQNQDSSLFMEADETANVGKAVNETGAKNQQWKMCPNPNGTYSLQDTASNKFLESNALQNNGQLLLAALNRSIALNEWYAIGNYDGSYCFKNRATGLMLQAVRPDSGGNVFAGQKTGASSQSWRLKEK